MFCFSDIRDIKFAVDICNHQTLTSIADKDDLGEPPNTSRGDPPPVNILDNLCFGDKTGVAGGINDFFGL